MALHRRARSPNFPSWSRSCLAVVQCGVVRFRSGLTIVAWGGRGVPGRPHANLCRSSTSHPEVWSMVPLHVTCTSGPCKILLHFTLAFRHARRNMRNSQKDRIILSSEASRLRVHLAACRNRSSYNPMFGIVHRRTLVSLNFYMELQKTHQGCGHLIAHLISACRISSAGRHTCSIIAVRQLCAQVY